MSEDYRVVRILLASLSFSYAAAELIIGWWIGSVSLLADSVQFLENGFLVLLSIAAIDRPVRLSAGTAGLLTGLIQARAVAALWFLYRKWNAPDPPDGTGLALTAIGALATNIVIVFALARIRISPGGIHAVAFTSARHGMFADAVIVAAGLAIMARASAWPDVVAGLAILILNASSSLDVFRAARGDLRGNVVLPRMQLR
jgi:Co/Zn/Cd efflux system component